jgi:DNA-binding NarL/FixJ family response regulator
MNSRVVVSDDQPLIRAGIGALLDVQPGIEVVATTGGGEDAVKAAATHQPDVVVLELDMPDGDGIDTIDKIVTDGLRETPQRAVRVLATTTQLRPHDAYAALRAGAAGFLVKTRPPEVLVSAVRAVAVAGTWLDTAVANDLLLELSYRPATANTESALARRLTAREREVLVLLAQGLGNTEIAARLVLSEATIRTHVGRILMKLNCPNRTRAVVLAYRSGLVRLGVAEEAAAGIPA